MSAFIHRASLWARWELAYLRSVGKIQISLAVLYVCYALLGLFMLGINLELLDFLNIFDIRLY